MLASGAAVGQVAGYMLTPQSGAYPLLWIMVLTSACAIVATGLIILRERHLAQMRAARSGPA